MPAARIVLWVTSIGAVALLVRSLMVGPIPLGLASALLAAYAVLTAVGWFFPRLQMYGDALWRGRPGQNRVALTFDDGPNPQSTRKVLRELERSGHRATFFVLGAKARAHPEVVREIHAAGHTLAIHGFIHDRLYAFKPPRRVVDDIRAAQDAVAHACGVRPTLFRPPLGHVGPRTAAGAKRAGVRLVAWSAKGLDGFAGSRPERVLRRVVHGLRDGAIVLLHDAAERDDYEPAGVGILPRLLQTIDQRGLRTVGVEEFAAEDDD